MLLCPFDEPSSDPAQRAVHSCLPLSLASSYPSMPFSDLMQSHLPAPTTSTCKSLLVEFVILTFSNDGHDS